MPTARSKQWRDIARLGHLIVEEIDLKNSNRVLGRWMVHRVAELMKRAETATDPAIKEAAEHEAQDLIIRLWEMRDFWPRGGPLTPILPTLHQLLDQQRYPSVYFTGSPVPEDPNGLLTQLMRLHRREMRELCQLLQATLPDSTVQSMQHLMSEHSADLSDDELGLLEISITPASFKPFQDEDEAEAFIDEPSDGVLAQNDKVTTQTPEADKFTEIKEQAMAARENLYAKIGQILADSNDAK